jgi:large subunit ribosomal protein L40e
MSKRKRDAAWPSSEEPSTPERRPFVTNIADGSTTSVAVAVSTVLDPPMASFVVHLTPTVKITIGCRITATIKEFLHEARTRALDVRIAVPKSALLVSAANGAMLMPDETIAQVSSELALCYAAPTILPTPTKSAPAAPVSSVKLSKGFKLLPALSAAEAALVARFDACPAELYKQIDEAAAKYPLNMVAVSFYDIDFPDAKPLLYTMHANTARSELSRQFPGNDLNILDFYTCRSDVTAGSSAMSFRELEGLIKKLPGHAAVACVFRRRAGVGRFVNVHDLTEHAPTREYKVLCSKYGVWNHRQALECLAYVGATHIKPAINPYRFYSSPSKEGAMPIYVQHDRSVRPPDDLYVFMDPATAPTEFGQIFVKGLTGSTAAVQIDVPDMSVWGLKKLVHGKFGVPINDQRLIFAGHQMEDACMCSEYGLSRESTVHLCMRLRGD